MKIPLFPLDVVLFPGTPLPLHIFEPRYKEMIGECLRGEAEFGMVRARPNGLSTIGCTARVISVPRRYPDGRMDIFCRGERRFAIESLHDDRSFFQAEVKWLPEAEPYSTRQDRQQCIALHFEMMELSGEDVRQFPQLDLDRPIAFLLAAMVPADLEFKQELLQLNSDAMRTELLIAFYETILPKLRRGVAAHRAGDHNGHVM
jgi:Lon protease-like protein